MPKDDRPHQVALYFRRHPRGVEWEGLVHFTCTDAAKGGSLECHRIGDVAPHLPMAIAQMTIALEELRQAGKLTL